MVYRSLLVLLMLLISYLSAFSAGEKIKIGSDDFITGIFCSPGGIFYCGTIDNGILRSADKGQHWSRIASSADPVCVKSASRIQTNDDKYVVVFVYDIEQAEFTLYSSVDSCKTWRAIMPGNNSKFEAAKAVLLKNNKTVVLNANNTLLMLDSGATSTKLITLNTTSAAKPIDFCVSKDDKVFVLLDDGTILKIVNTDFSHPETVSVIMPQGDRPTKISITEKENFFVYTANHYCYLLSASIQPEKIPLRINEMNQDYVFELASANEDYFVVRYNTDLTDFNVFETAYYRKSTQSKNHFYESTGEFNENTLDFYFSSNCMYLNVIEYSNPQTGQFIYVLPFGTNTAVESDSSMAAAGISLNSDVNPTRIEIVGQALPTLPELSVYDELGNKLSVTGIFSIVNNSVIDINTDCLPGGVYFVSVIQNGTRLLKKFIKA